MPKLWTQTSLQVQAPTAAAGLLDPGLGKVTTSKIKEGFSMSLLNSRKVSLHKDLVCMFLLCVFDVLSDFSTS